jgi:hypothetical protein
MFVSAAPAQAASCSGAVCMFPDINSGGSVILRGAWNVCGYYNNLTAQNFNDKISSIDNWAGYGQSFWKDADAKGGLLTIKSYEYMPTLVPLGFNDVISSVIWTG